MQTNNLTLSLVFAALLSFTLLVQAAHYDYLKAHALINGGNIRSKIIETRRNSTDYLQQKLDHFNPQDNNTFAQRYYVLEDYWNSPTGPIFLYVGGEGELTANGVFVGEQVEIAEQQGALVVGLEHRYYGESSPFTELTTQNLTYLSSHQALEDLAYFHEFITNKYNLTHNNTWVVFGCSYPGSLSAWFRLKYPHLAGVSLSGSSPVEAKADFWEYDAQVSQGAGQQCADALRNATQKIETLLSDSTTNKHIKQQFNCSAIEDDVAFLYVLADAAAFAVQYGLKNELCENRMDNATTVDQQIQAYANYTSYLWSILKSDCLNFSFYPATLTAVDPHNGIRQWMYQSCTEFGYFQTAPAHNSLRSTKITVEWHYQLCNELFGEQLVPNIQYTNSAYGSNEIQTSNTVFSNGNVDPWRMLSVTWNISDSVKSFVIPNQAHCANFGPSRSSDPLPLKQAREDISSMLGCYINKQCPEGCSVCLADCTCGDVSHAPKLWWLIAIACAIGGFLLGVLIYYAYQRSAKQQYETF